jgi:hypothetical protein
VPRIAARREIAGVPPEEVALLWWDLARWPGFVEGFSHVHRREDPWPLAGGRLVWEARHDSPRGRVAEEVVARDADGGGDVSLEDGRLQGLQRVRFAADDSGTVVTLHLEYSLKVSAAPVADLLYLRRRLRSGLERTLDRLGREAAADRELLADGG